MKNFSISLIITLLSYFQALGQGNARISGRVTDIKSESPIGYATIKLDKTEYGIVGDSNGYFSIKDIQPGTYTLRISAVGYKTLYKYDIVAGSGNIVTLNIALEEADSKLIEITASPFVKSQEAPLSIQSLSQQEIKSYPGGNNDIAKVVQSLPGVSGSVGFRNDVIIRGGAPNENVYYLDGVEIPNINHFSTQGSAGGPVGMLNVTFIEDVTLNTSAFPARYDNVLSGVLQFKQRNGDKDKVQGNLRLGASEFAGTIEGPLKKGSDKLTFIASVRRSYLQFLFKAIDLPFLPNYWDYQYKVNYKIDPKNELNFIGIGSIDRLTLNPPQNGTPEQLTILDGLPIYGQNTTTHGISWKRLINNGSMYITASTNYLDNLAHKYDNNDESNPANKRLDYKSTELESKLRLEVNKYRGAWKFNYGLLAQNCAYTNRTYQRIIPEVRDAQGNIIQQAVILNYNSSISFLKYGAFGQVSRKFLDNKLSTSLGLRTDMNSFMQEGNNPLKTLAPRLSLSYKLAPKLNLNASTGRYYKIPPYTILGFRSSDGSNTLLNKDVKYISCIHYSTGLEYLPARATRITLEGFYKIYGNYPVSVRDSISLANEGGNFGVLGNEKVASVGLGRTYGAELFFQQKFESNFYAVFSLTLYRSEFTGFDTKKYIPSAWDTKMLLSLTAGYKFPKNWELGLRFRYLGGNPYTPYDEQASLLSYDKTGAGVFDYNRLNTLRQNPYNTLDLRIEKRWNLKKVAITFYTEIQNAYNAKNYGAPEFTLARNPDNSFKTTDGQPFNGRNGVPYYIISSTTSLLPSIGLILEL